jgi:hypothetical protein
MVSPGSILHRRPRDCVCAMRKRDGDASFASARLTRFMQVCRSGRAAEKIRPALAVAHPVDADRRIPASTQRGINPLRVPCHRAGASVRKRRLGVSAGKRR